MANQKERAEAEAEAEVNEVNEVNEWAEAERKWCDGSLANLSGEWKERSEPMAHWNVC